MRRSPAKCNELNYRIFTQNDLHIHITSYMWLFTSNILNQALRYTNMTGHIATERMSRAIEHPLTKQEICLWTIPQTNSYTGR